VVGAAPVSGQTINTATFWTDGAYGGPWGWGSNQFFPSAGQTFTTPLTALPYFQSATLYVAYQSGSALSYQVLLYRWNGSSITGDALSASPVLTTPTSTEAVPLHVSMNRVRLAPNTQYIVILTAATTGNQALGRYRLARVTGDRYPDGNFLLNQTDSLVNGWVIPSGGSDRDLAFIFLFGPDPANTQQGLQSNAGAVRSVLGQRAATTTFALDYDCSVFDQHGFCVSVGFRNTQMGNNYADSGETAGLLTAAYRLTPEVRIGGFIDQGLVVQSPVGVDPKNTQPMLGAFAVYQESANFAGFTIRAALAYQQGDLRITRPELTDTEAGTGRARTTAFAFGGEIAYGVPLDGTWVAQPYAGLRRSDSQRQGYTETASDSVDFPITYNRFGQQVTSATAGLRLRGAITPEFSLTFGAGMEHTLDSKIDRYSGTSTISGLETFSINASPQQNATRAVGSAGMRYMVAANQALGFDASIRQMPYGNDPSITTMLRYSIGF
jgi:hypothetical protein